MNTVTKTTADIIIRNFSIMGKNIELAFKKLASGLRYFAQNLQDIEAKSFEYVQKNNIRQFNMWIWNREANKIKYRL